MPKRDPSPTNNSRPKVRTPEPPQPDATYMDRSEWVVKALRWFRAGWIAALPGDEQGCGALTDYRSDLVNAPCGLPEDFRVGALSLLPLAADEVIHLESVLLWTSPDDANRLAALIRKVAAEIESTDESAGQCYDEIELKELSRLLGELENAMARTAAQAALGAGAKCGGPPQIDEPATDAGNEADAAEKPAEDPVNATPSDKEPTGKTGQAAPADTPGRDEEGAGVDASQTDKRLPARHTPDDLIPAAVAVVRFHVSRATLQRAIKTPMLGSYRRENAPKNAPHRYSDAELAKLYIRRES